MEAKILLHSQNASNLAFSPLEIHLGKEKGTNQKREVGTSHNVGFLHQDPPTKGKSRKRTRISKEKDGFPHSKVESHKVEGRKSKRGKPTVKVVISCISMFRG